MKENGPRRSCQGLLDLSSGKQEKIEKFHLENPEDMKEPIQISTPESFPRRMNNAAL